MLPALSDWWLFLLGWSCKSQRIIQIISFLVLQPISAIVSQWCDEFYYHFAVIRPRPRSGHMADKVYIAVINVKCVNWSRVWWYHQNGMPSEGPTSWTWMPRGKYQYEYIVQVGLDWQNQRHCLTLWRWAFFFSFFFICLCCMVMFKRSNKQPGVQQIWNDSKFLGLLSR